MDRGPIRTPRSGGMINSKPDSTPTYRAAEAPAPEPEEPQAPAPVHRPSVSHHTQSIKEVVTPLKKKRRFLIPGIGALVVVILIVLGVFFLNSSPKQVTDIDTSKYQAVFFTNGQVYFGKLKLLNNQYLELTDIFYLQTQSSTSSTNPQNASTDSSSNVQLVKLGNEIHGPEDQMVISKDQVLFYENLKSDGKVVKSITQYKANNK